MTWWEGFKEWFYTGGNAATFALSFVGSALGIHNWWRGRPSLKIRFRLVEEPATKRLIKGKEFVPSHPMPSLEFSITNTGATAELSGLVARHSSGQITRLEDVRLHREGATLPYRIEKHTGIEGVVRLDGTIAEKRTLLDVYAQTTAGMKIRSSWPRTFLNELENRRHNFVKEHNQFRIEAIAEQKAAKAQGLKTEQEDLKRKAAAFDAFLKTPEGQKYTELQAVLYPTENDDPKTKAKFEALAYALGVPLDDKKTGATP